MIKTDEAADRNSCWNRARDDERVFVLLARDAAAPETLRFWAHHRVQDEAKRINYRPHGGGMAGHDQD